MIRSLTTLVLLATLLSAAASPGKEALLSADFETDPLCQGWWRGAYPHERPHGRWTDVVSLSGRHCLEAVEGWWASPRFEVKAYEYFRVRFSGMTEGKAFWMVQFYDQQGLPLDADHYSSFDHSEKWQGHEFYFRARSNATTAEIRFRAMYGPLYVDDVAVERARRSEVAQWADRIYASIPPVDLRGVPKPGANLKRTMEKLREGKPLRIVMLGDSIINDTGNSAYDVLIERKYPGARVEVVTSVRGGTGCWYYQQENRVQPYVLDHKPDLLVIGGISHNADVEAIRNVIRQVREKADPDILLMSGPVGLPQGYDEPYRWLPEPQRRAAFERLKNYRPQLARLAQEVKAEYLDMQSFWDAYEEAIRTNPMWLRRDPVHANERGRQVLARVLESYFAPPAAPKRPAKRK